MFKASKIHIPGPDHSPTEWEFPIERAWEAGFQGVFQLIIIREVSKTLVWVLTAFGGLWNWWLVIWGWEYDKHIMRGTHKCGVLPPPLWQSPRPLTVPRLPHARSHIRDFASTVYQSGNFVPQLFNRWNPIHHLPLSQKSFPSSAQLNPVPS